MTLTAAAPTHGRYALEVLGELEELALAAEDGRTLAQAFADYGVVSWAFARDPLFERAGGLLDAVAGAPRAAPADPVARTARISQRTALLARLAAAALRPTTPHGVLVLAIHGRAAAPGRWGDGWLAPYAAALRERPHTQVSLSAPAGSGARADAAAILGGRYLPFLAGLSPAALADHRRRRGAYGRRLEAIWAADVAPLLRARLSPDRAAALAPVFAGLARDLALAETASRWWERLLARGRHGGGSPVELALSFDALGHAGRALAWAARRAGVPVLGVQTGVIGASGAANLGYVLRSAPAGAPRPDKLLVWGEHSRAVLTGLGWSQADLIVAGAPLRRRSRRAGDRLLVIGCANLARCRALIPPEREAELIAAAVAAARDQHVAVTIRVHPEHRGSLYEASLRARLAGPGVEFSPAGRDLQDDLTGARAVLGGPSTATLQAVAAGLPVAVLAPGEDELLGAARYGLPVAGDCAQAAAAVAALLHDADALSAAARRYADALTAVPQDPGRDLQTAMTDLIA